MLNASGKFGADLGRLTLKLQHLETELTAARAQRGALQHALHLEHQKRLAAEQKTRLLMVAYRRLRAASGAAGRISTPEGDEETNSHAAPASPSFPVTPAGKPSAPID